MASRKDFSQVALDVVRHATGETPKKLPEPTAKQQAARKGGLVGGPARRAKLSDEERQQAATKAAKTRWSKSKTSAP